jgi:hypothetical protein
VHALEAGHHRHLAPLAKAPLDGGTVNAGDPGRAVCVGGQDRDLPALPGAGRKAKVMQHDGEEPGCDLLARGDDHVVFTGVVQGAGLAAPADQLVGLAGHGRDDDRHVVARLHLALHVPRHVADALHGGDGRAAELHHKAGHANLRGCKGAGGGCMRRDTSPFGGQGAYQRRRKPVNAVHGTGLAR